jgi:hypothetical protein
MLPASTKAQIVLNHTFFQPPKFSDKSSSVIGRRTVFSKIKVSIQMLALHADAGKNWMAIVQLTLN